MRVRELLLVGYNSSVSGLYKRDLKVEKMEIIDYELQDRVETVDRVQIIGQNKVIRIAPAT